MERSEIPKSLNQLLSGITLHPGFLILSYSPLALISTPYFPLYLFRLPCWLLYSTLSMALTFFMLSLHISLNKFWISISVSDSRPGKKTCLLCIPKQMAPLTQEVKVNYLVAPETSS
jgi:hypothetical protein